MPVINHLLGQSLNHLLWVILGLASWVGTYWQLYKMTSDTFADVITLVLSVLPIGVAFISLNVAAARWSGKTHYQAWVFLVLGVASLLYFAWLYLRQTKVRKVLSKRGILGGRKAEVARLVIQVLAGAISVLVSVTLLISGGWELIQGSVMIGLILAPVGAAMLVLDRGPDWRIKNWRINVFELTYSALTEGRASPLSGAAGASSATAAS